MLNVFLEKSKKLREKKKKESDDVSDEFHVLKKEVTEGFNGFVNGIEKGWKKIKGYGGDFKKLEEDVKKEGGKIEKKVLKGVGKLEEQLGVVDKDPFREFCDSISNFFNGFYKGLKEAFGKNSPIGEFLAAAKKDFGELINEGFEKIRNLIENVSLPSFTT